MILSKAGQPQRVFLIGFMGSGKTFLGKKLAAEIGWDFIDLDEKIERGAGMAVAEIFQKNGGEPAFRLLEQAALRETFLIEKTVVATGGGTPCFFGNMEEMRQNGLVIYLNTSKNLLFERLSGEKSHRPLIAGMAGNGLRGFIRAKVLERGGFYGRAHLTVFQWKGGAPILGKTVKKLRETGLLNR